MENYKVSVIICAAGKGERAGFEKNKLLAPLYGEPALLHTLRKFYLPEIYEVVVTSSPADLKEIECLCKPFGYKVTLGGSSRTESVKKALDIVSGDIVLIHDGARPFIKREIILNCIESVKKFKSGICAVKATDTAVYADGEIYSRLDRDKLFLLQTPQGFFTRDIKKAYSLAGDKVYTDDSAVYGEFITKPHIAAGDRENIKLTFKEDFMRGIPPTPLFEEGGYAVGFGVDVHAFGEGNFVTLGGVKIPCDRGLIAHSDGDVIIHAVMDALLSAAGLKDIGHYFPDSNKKYENADSRKLLSEVCKLLKEKNLAPANLSISVQAEKPKLAKYVDEMRENLGEVLAVDKEHIAIAAGTCEGLGFVGEGLGITAYCSVLLKKV